MTVREKLDELEARCQALRLNRKIPALLRLVRALLEERELSFPNTVAKAEEHDVWLDAWCDAHKVADAAIREFCGEETKS